MKINNKVALIVIVFVFLVVAGIAYYVGKNSKTDLVAENNSPQTTKLDQQQVFELKKECASFKDQIAVDYKKVSGWDRFEIEQVFYSPIKNSCLYGGWGDSTSSKGFIGFFINDYFNNEVVFYRDSTIKNNQEIDVIYDNAIEYLKGEGDLKYNVEKDWKI